MNEEHEYCYCKVCIMRTWGFNVVYHIYMKERLAGWLLWAHALSLARSMKMKMMVLSYTPCAFCILLLLRGSGMDVWIFGVCVILGYGNYNSLGVLVFIVFVRLVGCKRSCSEEFLLLRVLLASSFPPSKTLPLLLLFSTNLTFLPPPLVSIGPVISEMLLSLSLSPSPSYPSSLTLPSSLPHILMLRLLDCVRHQLHSPERSCLRFILFGHSGGGIAWVVACVQRG
jgi:hypothetical protein